MREYALELPDNLSDNTGHRPTVFEMTALAELFKNFGDVTRVRILDCLSEADEICVNDLSEALGMTQSAVSHQLRVLKNSNLVKVRREGKLMFYSLDDDHVRCILDTGIEHVREKMYNNG